MDDTKLTNFQVPQKIRDRFDRVCKLSGRSRSSVLIELMEDYTVRQTRILLQKSRRIQEADQNIRKSSKLMGYKAFVEQRERELQERSRNASEPEFDGE